MKVLQLNVGRGREATDLLRRTAEVEGADIVVIQEPYKHLSAWPGWRLYAHEKVATLVNESRDAIRLTQHSVPGLITVSVCGVRLANVYIAPETNMERAVAAAEALARATDGALVICGDFNAKCAAWGGETNDERGAKLMDLIGREGLEVLNDPFSLPTFDTANGRSWIDVTLARQADVTRWEVSGHETLSDHRLISYTVGEQVASEPAAKRFIIGKANWTKFGVECRQHMSGLDFDSLGAEEAAAAFQDAALKACKNSIPTGKTRAARSNTWWNGNLRRLRRDTRHARIMAQAERDPQARAAATETYKTRRREYKRAIKEAKINSLKKALADGDPRDPWGVAYKMMTAGKRKIATWATMQKNAGGEWTGDRRSTAAALIEKYFPADEAHIDTDENRRTRTESRRPWPAGRQDPGITYGEMSRTLRSMPKRKAPGADGFPAAGLVHLLGSAGTELGQVLNKCLNEGKFPRVWKRAQVAWLPKPSGDSLRPICLLPTIGKVLDKVLANRLSHFLETNGHLSDRQFGFRKRKSAVDAVNTAVETIRGAKAAGKHALVVALDIKNAFNSAWYPKLRCALAGTRCPVNLAQTISSFLDDRTVSSESIEVKTERGCPQGSCLGPILWLLLMEEWFSLVEKIEAVAGTTVHAQAYADDQLIIISGPSVKKLEGTWTRVWGACEAWAAANKLQYSPDKTEAMFAGASALKRSPILKMGEATVLTADSIKYLGIIIDRGLMWIEHVKHVRGRIAAAAHRVRAVAGKEWGTHPETLRLIYRGAIRPALLYAAEVWGERATDSRVIKHLAAAQRPFMLGVTKAYRTTSNAAVQIIAGCAPLHLEAAARHKRWKRLRADGDREVLPAELPHPAAPRMTWGTLDDEETLKGTWVYSDASAGDQRVGLAAVSLTDGNETGQWMRRAAGDIPSHRAELWALGLAVEKAIALGESAVNIATDSKVALQMTAGRKDRAAWQIGENVRRAASSGTRLQFWWAPGKTRGIAAADRLARQARKADCDALEITIIPDKAMISKLANREMMEAWGKEWDVVQKGRTTYRFFPKPAETRKDWNYQAVCMLTGHGPFGAYYLRFKLRGGTGLCSCGSGDLETNEHVSEKCQQHERKEARERFRQAIESLGRPYPMVVSTDTTAGEVDAFNRWAAEVVKLDDFPARGRRNREA